MPGCYKPAAPEDRTLADLFRPEAKGEVRQPSEVVLERPELGSHAPAAAEEGRGEAEDADRDGSRKSER